MKKTKIHSLKYLIASSLFFLLFFAGVQLSNPEPKYPETKVPMYAKLPYDTPLDAVKWIGGFWGYRMDRLRNVYIPGTVDGSFLELTNGASLRNFLRAAGLEKGGAVGRSWSDGDCYLLLDVASRMYAYKPDEYLKGRLEYWIPILEKVQREDGFLDTWTILRDFDTTYADVWAKFEKNSKRGSLQGGHRYNLGHLHVAADTYKKVFKDDKFDGITDKTVNYYGDNWPAITNGLVGLATANLYERTADQHYLDILKRALSGSSSVFGPPLREAQEVFGHNCATAHDLIGGTLLFNYTGEQAVLDALRRLAENILTAKIYVTGAIGPVYNGRRPELTVNGKKYPGAGMGEAIGEAYDLPNETAYCESCGQALYMEFFYRMFRLTGEARYMDAAEHFLYNTLPGCVDIDRPKFFYANPQEQLPGSDRRHESDPQIRWNKDHYTWTRTYTKLCTCCPPKVLRGLAMSNEIAYNVNDEGLWVNLYGSSTFKTDMPSGGALECQQTTDYPWNGKIKLVIIKTESEKSYTINIRIPGWLNSPVMVRLNGKIIEKAAESGRYYSINRKWKMGDRIEMELPMPVKYMMADPRIKDDLGKVAVKRGPVVYCLEDYDIPEGLTLDSLYISGNNIMTPVYTDELGGLIKLKGTMIYGMKKLKSRDLTMNFRPGKGLYQEIRLGTEAKVPDNNREVKVSLIPYYARLNRSGNYFKVWLSIL